MFGGMGNMMESLKKAQEMAKQVEVRQSSTPYFICKLDYFFFRI